jgi:3-hydroxyisobutyrate dehydrogenase
MQTIKTGWIGLGTMGSPMCTQLIKAGYPVTIYNRSKEKEEALKALGASTALTPALVMEESNIIFIMVSDDAAINEIFGGDDGLLAAKVTGRIIINMSSVSPGISKKYAELCKQAGNRYLDAPVSGSLKQALDAQLVIMVGGEASIFSIAKPLLEYLGKLVMHIGDTGAGNTAKLAINTLLGIQAQGLAEAVAFAKNNGIETTDLLTLINNSALASPFLKIKGDAIIADNFTPAFALKHIVKDLGLAADEGMASPLGITAYNSYKEASAQFAEEDIIAIYKQFI